MDNVNKFCLCGHLETSHKHRDATVEQIIQSVVRRGILVPQYDPNLVKPAAFLFISENKVYPYEQVESMIINLQENHSTCEGKRFVTCHCDNFKADNLKYLEDLSERQTRQTIH